MRTLLSLEQAAETVFILEDGGNDPLDAPFELVDKSFVLREVTHGEALFCLSELTRA
jgi:hypothetical protein